MAQILAKHTILKREQQCARMSRITNNTLILNGFLQANPIARWTRMDYAHL